MKFYVETKNKFEIKKLLRKYKIVKYTGETESNIDGFYKNLACSIGRLVNLDEDLASGNKNKNYWIDIKYDPNIKGSFRHSNGKHFLHTDGSYESYPPDIVLLFCKINSLSGGETIFYDAKKIKTLLKKVDIKLYKKIKSLSFLFKKGNDYKISKIYNPKFNKINWNFYRAYGNENVKKSFFNFLTNCVEPNCLKISLLKGESLFFHDFYVLHGRTSFSGERWLKKGGIKL